MTKQLSRRIAKANSNHVTLQALLKAGDEHAAWVAVVAFYKALHLVEAVFEHDGRKHDRNHESRENALKRERRYEKIYRHYRQLGTVATVSRYLTVYGQDYECFSQYMSAEDVKAKVVDHHLRQLEKSVTNLIGEHGLQRV